MLIEKTLFGTIDLVATAIEALRTFANSKPYYLAFSGGKDSCVCDALLKMSGLPYSKHFQRACEPPEVIRFIQRYHPDCITHRPAESMWTLISTREKNPPLRQQPWCCKHLKESEPVTDGTIMVQGIRWAESSRRASRRKQYEAYENGSRCLNPIISWSDGQVWEFITSHRVPYCCLYDTMLIGNTIHRGRRRVGCAMCPQRGEEGMRADALRWPKIAAAYVRALDRAIATRAQCGMATTFNTGQEWFDWWVGQNQEDADDCSLPLFDN